MPTAAARSQSVAPAQKNGTPTNGAPSNGRPTGTRPWNGRRAPAAAPQPGKPPANRGKARPDAPKAEAEILFQKFFHSVGPRTYAAQVKRAGNGNHFLVLTEGKRDEATDEVRKTRLFLFSEDFGKFFQMLHETAKFIREHPVPDDVREKRAKFWAKKNSGR
jgi:hypothetical protein